VQNAVMASGRNIRGRRMTDDTPRDYRDDIELDDELDLIRIAGREDARERFVACRYDLSVCHEEMRDSDATPALRSAGQPTRYAMPDETDEPDDEAMRDPPQRRGAAPAHRGRAQCPRPGSRRSQSDQMASPLMSRGIAGREVSRFLEKKIADGRVAGAHSGPRDVKALEALPSSPVARDLALMARRSLRVSVLRWR
jgi:hypothetical protein